jgi:phage gp36-like protein
MYLEWADLITEIPADFATGALDDDNDGSAEMFDAVAEAASREVDAYLEGRYTVPLTDDPLPAIVKSAAVLFCAEKCYSRRGQSERFPIEAKTRLQGLVNTLKAIRDGKTQLLPGRASKKLRGAMTTGAARTHSSAGFLNC